MGECTSLHMLLSYQVKLKGLFWFSEQFNVFTKLIVSFIQPLPFVFLTLCQLIIL
jgi:hypothetical protein